MCSKHDKEINQIHTQNEKNSKIALEKEKL